MRRVWGKERTRGGGGGGGGGEGGPGERASASACPIDARLPRIKLSSSGGRATVGVPHPEHASRRVPIALGTSRRHRRRRRRR